MIMIKQDSKELQDSKEFDFMFLASFMDSIDDVRTLFGEEYAAAFAYRIVYYGVRRKIFNDLNSVCNATIESIIPKINKSAERAAKTKAAAICKASKEKHESKPKKSDSKRSSDEG